MPRCTWVMSTCMLSYPIPCSWFSNTSKKNDFIFLRFYPSVFDLYNIILLGGFINDIALGPSTVKPDICQVMIKNFDIYFLKLTIKTWPHMWYVGNAGTTTWTSVFLIRLDKSLVIDFREIGCLHHLLL